MNALEGKVALITGARGGLGRFITEAFLAAGARVVGVSRSIQASDFPHPRFAALPADLSRGEAARKMAGDIMTRFVQTGDRRFHVQTTNRGQTGRFHVRRPGDEEARILSAFCAWPLHCGFHTSGRRPE